MGGYDDYNQIDANELMTKKLHAGGDSKPDCKVAPASFSPEDGVPGILITPGFPGDHKVNRGADIYTQKIGDIFAYQITVSVNGVDSGVKTPLLEILNTNVLHSEIACQAWIIPCFVERFVRADSPADTPNFSPCEKRVISDGGHIIHSFCTEFDPDVLKTGITDPIINIFPSITVVTDQTDRNPIKVMCKIDQSDLNTLYPVGKVCQPGYLYSLHSAGHIQ